MVNKVNSVNEKNFNFITLYVYFIAAILIKIHL